MALPATDGVRLTRTDFAPDGRRAVEFGLTLTAGSQAANLKVNVDAHSELMSAYPWGSTTPDQTTFNLPDKASFNGKQLVFTDTGTPPVANASPHDWAAIVGTTGLTPASGQTGADFRGPQDPPVICPVGSEPDKFRCDDTAYGKGAGGELTYPVSVPAGGSRTVWFTVAGSDQGLSDAQAQFQAASANPAAELAAKIAARQQLNSRTQVSLPGDPALAESVTWSKQDMADLTQQADNLKIRDTEEGTVYPAPLATVPGIRFEGAGFPDYPWMFATDQEYTVFALLAGGQFATAEDGLRSLAQVSIIANHDSGKVVHETVTDGSVYFGLNDEPGDIDETAKLPDAVAMVWRWTGDNAFRDEMYDFAKKNMQYMIGLTNGDDDLWPDGSANVESTVLGADAVDAAVYTIRGLYDLADMAASKGDTATRQWADSHAAAMVKKFSGAWWMPSIPQFADSLADPANTQLMQRWWTGLTPMEAQLYPDGVPQPGLVPPSEALPALALRETSCYSGTYGLYVEGGPGCDPGTYTGKTQQAYTLNTGVMAVGLGNYGLLGPGQQQRYTDDLAQLQLGSVAEQPGAMPEIGPSPDFTANINQPFNERSSLDQAWGNVRRALAGGEPAARGRPATRQRPARGAAGCAGRPVVGERDEHQGRRGLGRRRRHAQRQLLYDNCHRRPGLHPACRRHLAQGCAHPPGHAQRIRRQVHRPGHQRGPASARVRTVPRPDLAGAHRRQLTDRASPVAGAAVTTGGAGAAGRGLTPAKCWSRSPRAAQVWVWRRLAKLRPHSGQVHMLVIGASLTPHGDRESA